MESRDASINFRESTVSSLETMSIVSILERKQSKDPQAKEATSKSCRL